MLCQHLRTAGQPEYSNVCVYNHSKENLNYLLPRLEMTSQSPRPHLAGHQKHRLRGLHQAFHGLELVNARHCNKFTEERYITTKHGNTPFAKPNADDTHTAMMGSSWEIILTSDLRSLLAATATSIFQLEVPTKFS